jgi:hypothetical protein
MGMSAEELEFASFVGGGELLREQPAEQLREHQHRQEAARLAGDPSRCVGRDAATWNDHMHVRMVGHGRAPGVQDGSDTDAGAEMLTLRSRTAGLPTNELYRVAIAQRFNNAADAPGNADQVQTRAVRKCMRRYETEAAVARHRSS